MKIELADQTALVCGPASPVLDVLMVALASNGAAVTRDTMPDADPLPDLLIQAHALRPLRDSTALETASLDAIGQAMRTRGSGRIILLVSAVAAVPSRRFPEASVAAGAAVLAMRTLAMRLGPSVLVNAVGCGAIAEDGSDLVAGDACMLSHVPSGRAGTIDDIVNTTLFLCDPKNSYMTGQLLTVDGGWSAGYGRNF